MRISYNWLKRYISPIPTPQECSALLTATGLEVESFEAIETVKGGLKGLVVGEVMTCVQHPNADRLRLTTVNVGAENVLSIVCGAPNVAVGQKVIVATIGTELYPSEGDSFKIKESKIRGELSQGMICAEDEIGLGKSHDGIMVLPATTQVGMPAADYFGMEEDFAFEIGLTPNRTDAMSHSGVARDLRAALYADENFNFQLPDVKTQLDEKVAPKIQVEIKRPEALKRYSGILLENIHVSESPDWLKNALLSIGLRPINNVVDITNFVMHELGQPLHAFDADKISGNKVIVDTCPKGTIFKTLDGVERKLNETELMICNAVAPMCIAGVFGGSDSGVTESTKNIFIESACFDAVWVRKTSKLHALKTDSSFRFERGTDPEMTVTALERACDLLIEIATAKISGGLFDFYPTPVEWAAVNMQWKNLDRLIGEQVPKETVKTILTHLGIRIETESTTGLKLSIPPFKVDVKNEYDITEEVLRIYGYNTIEIPTQIRSSVSSVDGPNIWKIKNRISDHLSSLGFSEILNNSLSSSSYSKLLPEDTAKAVKLLNPLSSELDIMRQTLLFGMCESMSRNVNRQQNDLAFYEWGKTYFEHEGDKFTEHEKLSIALCGNMIPSNWHGKSQSASFYSLRGILENVFGFMGISNEQVHFEEMNHPAYMNAFSLKVKKKILGIVGELSQSTRKTFDLPKSIWYAEIDWQTMLDLYMNRVQTYREAPKYPAVRRDLALVLESSVSFESITQIAREMERKILKDITLFDVYTGDKLAKGKKSYAVSFLLQDEEQTLTDKQVEKTMEKFLKAFSEKLGAELRN
jgi:phenylalanyl-tRNA synthetase beta chain